MVRKAYAHKHLLEYLQCVAKENAFSFGLIMGQPADGKDYILHFARTPLVSSEMDDPKQLVSLAHISESAVADHSVQTTRMLPGGLYVLGIFIVGVDNIFKPLHKKCLSLLQSIQARLGMKPWLYGNHANTPERLVLHFNPRKHEYTLRSINITSGTTDTVNLEFSEKDLPWCQVQCKFEFTENVTFISQANVAMPLKNQLKKITARLNSELEKSTFIFDGKICNDQETLESLNLSKRQSTIPKEDDSLEAKNVINAVILISSTQHGMQSAEIFENEGSIRIRGQIASSVWLNPETTYKTTARAIIEDIVRSFQARLSMHFDSLTEGEGAIFNDTCSMHEPPRRVLIPLPNGNMSLSDYLFPGEGPQEAQNSFQDVLDVHIAHRHAVKDVEGQADLAEYYNELGSKDSNEPLPMLPTDPNKFMYILGTVVALSVLILSILIHWFQHSTLF